MKVKAAIRRNGVLFPWRIQVSGFDPSLTLGWRPFYVDHEFETFEQACAWFVRYEALHRRSQIRW